RGEQGLVAGVVVGELALEQAPPLPSHEVPEQHAREAIAEGLLVVAGEAEALAVLAVLAEAGPRLLEPAPQGAELRGVEAEAAGDRLTAEEGEDFGGAEPPAGELEQGERSVGDGVVVRALAVGDAVGQPREADSLGFVALVAYGEDGVDDGREL